MGLRDKVQTALALPETIREVSLLSLAALLLATLALGVAIATAVRH
jgi:hypothetical protein